MLSSEGTQTKDWLCIVYVTIAVLYMTIFGGLLIHYSNDLKSYDDPSADYLFQITEDWTKSPYVSLSVTTDWFCPKGETEVFTRAWYGMNMACYCFDKTPKFDTGEKCTAI